MRCMLTLLPTELQLPRPHIRFMRTVPTCMNITAFLNKLYISQNQCCMQAHLGAAASHNRDSMARTCQTRATLYELVLTALVKYYSLVSGTCMG